MKTSKEITKWLLENATNERGQIELNGLDLNVDLLIKNCNIKNYDSNSNEVKGNYNSNFNEVEGYYNSYSNEVEGNYDSNSNEVKGNYNSHSNEVKGNYYSHSNEVKGEYDSYSNVVEGYYDSYYNEVKGNYYSHYNKVKGNYNSNFNEVEGYYDSHYNKVKENQYYPKYAIVKGKTHQVDLTDNYYLIIEKSTTKNGVTIIKGFDKDNNKIWLYKNSFVGYHASTKQEAKEGFKRKLKGFKKNIELIETIKEAGKITMLDYHNLTGACVMGIQDFADKNNIKLKRRYTNDEELRNDNNSQSLTLAELKEHLQPNDYGYNMIIKWLKEEEL